MSLSSLSARRPVGTAMIYVCVVVLGIVASQKLAVDLMPEVDMPRISVTTSYTGVSPEEIESLITRPIEQSLSTIEGVDRLSSTSAEGLSRVEVWFEWGRDLEAAVNDIRERIDRVRGVLPEDADAPTIFKFNLSDMPVAFLGLSGSGDSRRLRFLAEDVLSRRLERVPGVASADVRGGREREIQVQLDRGRLAALGISPAQVTAALTRENRNVSAGDMLATGKEVMIRTVGEFGSLTDISQTVVASREGRPILVGDLGKVEDSFREIQSELWIDAELGMRVFIQKQSGANTVEVVDRLHTEVDSLNREFAGRAQMSFLFDGSTFIRQSVSNVERGALFGAMLAVLVLLLFLRDSRATVIISTAIPISVLATVALMYFSGFTLNIISIGGIALGVGMLVDSSIVVLENIYRKRAEGMSSLDAAIEGSREVSLAILAGTLTTVAVFLPVIFISGFAGVFFKEMAVVVSFALFCALAVAMTLIPAAAAKWLPDPTTRRERRHGRLGDIANVTGAWLERLDEGYGHLIEKVLGRPVQVVLGSLVLLVASFFLVPLIGFELMPESDEGQLNLNAELAVGTPVEVTMNTMQELELEIRGALQEGELRHLVTTAGPESWWRPASGNTGSMEIMLVPVTERDRSVEEVAMAMRRAVANVPGAEIRIYPTSSNMMTRMMRGGGDQRLTVEIRGHELDVADALAARVVDILRSVPGVAQPRIDRESGQLERTVHADRARLAELGLSGSDVASAVEHYVLGKVATRYRDGGDEYDVRVQLRAEDRALLEQLPQLPIVTPLGQVIPIGAVASLDQRLSPMSIARQDQQRILRVTADLEGRALGDVIADVNLALQGLEVPESFSVSMGGEFEEQQKVFSDLLLGVALALFLVYTVMAIQFESLLQPLIIMTAVPFSLIGVFLTLSLTGTTFNMNSFLGLIVLVGIVVNNAIVLIDYVNLLRREHGLGLIDALVSSCRRRLRPILMTTLTTALGLVPLAIGLGEGSEIQAPLARVVVGGLLTSTLITLIFVPSLYLLVERFRARKRLGAVASERPDLGELPTGTVGAR